MAALLRCDYFDLNALNSESVISLNLLLSSSVLSQTFVNPSKYNAVNALALCFLFNFVSRVNPRLYVGFDSVLGNSFDNSFAAVMIEAFMSCCIGVM